MPHIYSYTIDATIFTLTASLPQICEALYLHSQIRKCRVALSHTGTSSFLLLLRINDYPYQLCEQRTCKAMTVNYNVMSHTFRNANMSSWVISIHMALESDKRQHVWIDRSSGILDSLNWQLPTFRDERSVPSSRVKQSQNSSWTA